MKDIHNTSEYILVSKLLLKDKEEPSQDKLR